MVTQWHLIVGVKNSPLPAPAMMPTNAADRAQSIKEDAGVSIIRPWRPLPALRSLLKANRHLRCLTGEVAGVPGRSAVLCNRKPLEGFTELTVRNPKNNRERVLVHPCTSDGRHKIGGVVRWTFFATSSGRW